MRSEKEPKRKHEEQDIFCTTAKGGADMVAKTVNVCCPICQMTLSHVDLEHAERHVNGCLDIEYLEKRKRARQANNNNSTIPIKSEMIAERVTISETTNAKVTKHDSKPSILMGSVEEMLQEIENTLQPSPSFYSLSGPKYTQGHIHKNARTDLKTGDRNTKPLPSYKRMPHTSFTVDAFKYGKLEFCTGYFLTHFHSDHYGGLTKKFSGNIYCTRITANCIIKKLGVNPDCVYALPMNTRCLVQDIYVTFIDANHCPGSAIILFEVPHSGNLVRIVHTGDFRASDSHISQILHVFETDVQQPITPYLIASCNNKHRQWKRVVPMIDYLYLDTTYLQPAHTFPTQESIIHTVAEFCRNVNDDPAYLTDFLQRIGGGFKKSTHESNQNIRSGGNALTKSSLITRWFRPKPSSQNLLGSFKRQRVLFVVGSYSIGKERLFIEIARQLNTKIYVSRDKRLMLECIGSPSLLALLANNMSEAQVHVVSMSMINMRGMSEYLQAVQKEAAFFSSIVAFSPTGWSHGGAYYSGRKQQPLVWPEKSACVDVGPKLDDHDIERMVSHIASSARIQVGVSSNSAFCIDSLKPRGSSNKVTIFPVSYSEHSSFTELAKFICSLRIGTVVPTVFASDEKNKLAKSWLQHWEDLNIEFGRLVRNSTNPRMSPDRHSVPCFEQLV